MGTLRQKTFLVILLFLSNICLAQSAQDIIAAIKNKQASLTGISYELHRTDTLVTGHIRTITGKALIQVSKKDSLFGCLFWAQRDGFDQQTIYNGRIAYVTDTVRKVYQLISEPSDKLMYGTTGGQILVPDLIRLDTAQANKISLSQDQHHYFLTFHYPDLTQYDVSKRYKLVTIDKTRMLPVTVRKHQETLGKVQDLTFQIADLQLSEHPVYDFYDPAFLKSFTQELAAVATASTASKLRDTQAPDLQLWSIDSTSTYPIAANGKVTLLDFWEVWCGPCIASMPKIQQLSDRYGDKGLQVYGIIHETTQLDVVDKWVKKTNTTFPMLLGIQDSKKAFQLTAIPLYVLIDKSGKIVFANEGFSDELERQIQKALDR